MKWLAVVWRSLVVVWSRAVDELALRRPCAPCPPLESPLCHPSPVSQSHRRSLLKTFPIPPLTFAVSFPLPSFLPFQRPSLLYLFFSTIITLPGMSATSLALATPDLHPELPLYNCFSRYLSILFTTVAFTLANIAKLPRTSKTRWSLIRQTSVGIRVGINSERG